MTHEPTLLLALSLFAAASPGAHAAPQAAHLKSLDCPKPEYPPPALRENPPWQGSVKLRLLVGVDGVVRGYKVLQTSGYRDLDSAARDAYARCPFEPAHVDGVPQESLVEVGHNFVAGAAQETPSTDVPPAVSRLAQTYAASPQAAHEQPDRERLLRTYAGSFFEGYIQPDVGISTPSALLRDAYEQGRAYRRSHPGSEGEILGGYGYERVQVEGTWKRGYQQSDFMPKDRANEPWWLAPLPMVLWPDAQAALPEPTLVPAHVQITGYLSQPGKYGYSGRGRQLLSTSVTFIDAPTP